MLKLNNARIAMIESGRADIFQLLTGRDGRYPRTKDPATPHFFQEKSICAGKK